MEFIPAFSFKYRWCSGIMQDSHSYNFRSFWASPVAQLAKRETWNVGDLGLIARLRRKWLPTPVFQPGEFHGLYSPWGHKELDVTEWLSLHSKVALVVKNPPANAGDIRDEGSISGSVRSLEEGMAIHSSVLAWRIPRTEEPGRLQSIGSQRVRHNWRDLAHILG